MNQIKELRLQRGLSQQALAKLCNVHQTAVSQWEKDRTCPDRDTILELSRIFGVSVDFLMGTETAKKKTVPVLGYVRAGIPMEAVEQILDYEEISEDMAATGEFFALQIRGDSMEPRFCEGDVVIVRQQPEVESGEIAVVLVNGNDATVKKIIKKENNMVLVPLNPAYEPTMFTPQEIDSLPVRIIGKVAELRAKF